MQEHGALAGRVALITGAGRGIGRAIALSFAREGACIAAGARTLSQVEETARLCTEFGAQGIALELDVTESTACDETVDSCVRRWGRVDILVNNAGTAGAQKFLSIDDAAWRRTIEVNLDGAFYMTRAALPGMLERRDGRVISVASIVGKIGGAYIAPYAASKHALLGLMRSLAAEYPKSGVTFNSVCPAYVDTPLTEETVRRIMERTGRSTDEALAALYTPQGRLVHPDEVAALCVFLASEAGRSINGQAINVDGGQVQW